MIRYIVVHHHLREVDLGQDARNVDVVDDMFESNVKELTICATKEEVNYTIKKCEAQNLEWSVFEVLNESAYRCSVTFETVSIIKSISR